MGCVSEVLDAGVELCGIEGFQTAGGEGLAGEGSEHGAMDDGLAECRQAVRRVALGGEVASHAAEEGVAGTRGVGEGFERVGGAAEDGGGSS